MRVRVNLSRRRPATGSSQRQEGAAAVEMALLLLFLLAPLVFAVIQFGIIFGQDLGIGNGAREGARFAASSPDLTCTQITDLAKDASVTVLVAKPDVTVRVYRGSAPPAPATPTNVCGVGKNKPCVGSTSGDNVYVTTRFNGELFIPFVISRPTFPLQGNGGFACEFS